MSMLKFDFIPFFAEPDDAGEGTKGTSVEDDIKFLGEDEEEGLELEKEKPKEKEKEVEEEEEPEKEKEKTVEEEAWKQKFAQLNVMPQYTDFYLPNQQVVTTDILLFN